MEIKIKKGFEYAGKRYGFYKNKFYRLAFISKNGRENSTIEIKPQKNMCYHINRQKRTIRWIKDRLNPVEWICNFHDKSIPF